MVDTTVWFGVGASVFFLAVVLYLWFAATRGEITSPFYFLPPVLVTVAGTAYAGMTAVTLGLLPDVATVELIRFADWTVTTPIITYYLALLADTDSTTRLVATAANVGMLAFGYAFVVVSGPLQWVAFGASSALFLGLIYMFTRTFSSALVGSSQTARSLYLSLRDLTVATWSFYPVVYVLGPAGASVIAAPDLSFVVTVLDLAAKVGLVTVLLLRQYELSTFLTRDAPSAASEL